MIVKCKFYNSFTRVFDHSADSGSIVCDGDHANPRPLAEHRDCFPRNRQIMTYRCLDRWAKVYSTPRNLMHRSVRFSLFGPCSSILRQIQLSSRFHHNPHADSIFISNQNIFVVYWFNLVLPPFHLFSNKMHEKSNNLYENVTL